MNVKSISGHVWNTERQEFVSAEVRWNTSGLIESIRPTPTDAPWFIVPGFIDEHVHGGGGADAMDGSVDSLNIISGELTRYGVSAYVLTTMSASQESLLESVAAAAKYSIREGAELLGLHLEGPYLSPQYSGAQPKNRLRPIDNDEISQLIDASGGTIRIMTMAPELPGALKCISWAVNHGIHINLGHTAADYCTTRQAIDQGADGMAHLFNGMPSLHHRDPGPVGLALSDSRVYVEIIADGVHICPPVIQMTWAAAKGRVLAITDGVSAIGLAPGRHHLGEQEVIVDERAVRLSTGSLAGSKLTLDQAYRNLMCWHIPESEIIDALSTRVARRLGLTRQGSLNSGCYADMVLLNPDRTVHQTIVRGKICYTQPDQ